MIAPSFSAAFFCCCHSNNSFQILHKTLKWEEACWLLFVFFDICFSCPLKKIPPVIDLSSSFISRLINLPIFTPWNNLFITSPLKICLSPSLSTPAKHLAWKERSGVCWTHTELCYGKLTLQRKQFTKL